MSKEEIYEKVKVIFINVFHNDEVSLETKRDDIPNWDSLTHVMFLSSIQKELNIKFNMNDMINLNSIGKIVDCIAGLL